MTTSFSTLLGLLVYVPATIVVGAYLYLLWLAVKKDGITMKEMGQVTIMLMIIYMVYRDANRDHEWAYFSETIYLFLIIGLASLAGIKQLVDMKKPFTKVKDDETQLS